MNMIVICPLGPPQCCATLERFSDQRISLIDATIASMAVRLNLRMVMFDKRHFGLMGAKTYE